MNRVWLSVGVLAVAAAALAGHLLITDGLEDRIDSLDSSLGSCRVEAATEAFNAATLRGAVAKTEAELATARAAAAESEQRRRQAVGEIREQMRRRTEADRTVSPEPEEMNKWLTELF